MNDKTHESITTAGAPALRAPGLVPELPADAFAAGVRAVCVVVDDEPGVQNIVVGAAAALGCQVARFRSADNALKAIGKLKPTLLFLDVSLEGSDAVNVIRSLGASGFTGAVQLMSGRDAQTMEEVKRVGERHSLTMLPLLRKPFRPEAVRAIVRQHLLALLVDRAAGR
jgi:CheY-like chemotaxis protein